MKIALITMHAARNYGAVLQTYALQHILQLLGDEIVIINYKRDNQQLWSYMFHVNKKFRKNPFLRFAFVIKTIIPKIRTSVLFSKFISRYISLSPIVRSGSEIAQKVKSDLYLVGSDQVWNPQANDGFDGMYFFEGCKGVKVSYASSIGIYELNDEEQEYIKNKLQNFRRVSVRENSSIFILKRLGIEAECMLDPTLLMDQDDWKQLAAPINIGNNYLLIYYFGNASNIMHIANKIAKERNLQVCRISVGFEKYKEDDIVVRFVSPEQFISLFLYASFVITNSFHGTAFSINFNKEFFCYPTTEHNARFDSILQMFNLEKRNLRELDENTLGDLKPIDFILLQEKLQEQRKKSIDYIESILHT